MFRSIAADFPLAGEIRSAKKGGRDCSYFHEDVRSALRKKNSGMNISLKRRNTVVFRFSGPPRVMADIRED